MFRIVTRMFPEGTASVVALMVALGMACVSGSSVAAGSAVPFKPLPLQIHLDQRKVKLGERLFGDVNLSSERSLACASCHQIEKGGMDNLPLSAGRNGELRDRNTPTIFNVAFNYRMHWDGATSTLEEGARKAITVGQGMTWPVLLERLNADQGYRRAFRDIYGDQPSEFSVIDALVQYEKSLTTPNSRFDRYLRGDESVLSKDELAGYRLFRSYGCAGCHQGVNIGGNVFQKFRVFSEVEWPNGRTGKVDPGRYAVTGRDRDREVFRVPSLRNIALTAPYLHDGSIETLEDTIRFMARGQLGRELTDQDTQLIVKFLGTLTGEYAGVPLSEYQEKSK